MDAHAHVHEHEPTHEPTHESASKHTHQATILLRPGMTAPERMPNHFTTTIDRVNIVNVGGKDRIILDHGMIDESYENSLLIVNFEKDGVITRKLFLYHKVNGIFIFEYMCEQHQFKYDYDPALTYDVGDMVMYDNRHFVCLQKIRGQAPCFGPPYIPTQSYSKLTYVLGDTGHVYRAKTPIAGKLLTDPAWLLQPWKYINDVGFKFPTWWRDQNDQCDASTRKASTDSNATCDRTAASFMINMNIKLTFSPTSGGAVYPIMPPQLVGVEVMDRSHLPAHMQRCYKNKQVCKVYYCHELHVISAEVTRSEPSVGFETLIYLLPDGVYEPTPGISPIPLEDHHRRHVGSLMILTADTCPIVLQPLVNESMTFRQICVSPAVLCREPVYSKEYLNANRALYDAVTTIIDPDKFTHDRLRRGLGRIQSGDTTVDDPDKIRQEFVEWTNVQRGIRNELSIKAARMLKEARIAAEATFQRSIKAPDEIDVKIKSHVMKYVPADIWMVYSEKEIYDSVSWDVKGQIITATMLQVANYGLKAMWLQVCDLTDGNISSAFEWAQARTNDLVRMVTQLPKNASVKKLKPVQTKNVKQSRRR